MGGSPRERSRNPNIGKALMKAREKELRSGK